MLHGLLQRVAGEGRLAPVRLATSPGRERLGVVGEDITSASRVDGVVERRRALALQPIHRCVEKPDQLLIGQFVLDLAGLPAPL